MPHPFLGSPGQCAGAFDRGPPAGTGKSQGGRQVGSNRQCQAGTGTIWIGSLLKLPGSWSRILHLRSQYCTLQGPTDT